MSRYYTTIINISYLRALDIIIYIIALYIYIIYSLILGSLVFIKLIRGISRYASYSSVALVSSLAAVEPYYSI